jgi:hypothetical protein
VGLVEFRSFEDALHPCSNAILSANKYIRKMRGKSQSVLVRANDGNHYFVKMTNNPVGANSLANELIGALLAKAVGLPVAESKGIYFSDSFIDSHPQLWFELPSGVRRPNKGVQCGSLLLGQTSGTKRPTEYISRSRINKIINREAFLGMYLFDIWANHQDNRQAIFSRLDENTLKVSFIDHGHMFGGPRWNFDEHFVPALHLETAVYANLWQDEQVASWISIFQSVIPAALQSAADVVHPQWCQGDLSDLIGRLTARLACLPDLIGGGVSRNSWLFQQSIVNELQSSDFEIDDLRAPRNSVYRSRATA